MRKSVKILLILSIVVIIASIPVILLISNVMKMGERAKPFNLDEAPEYIILTRNDIREKLENDTFSLEEDKQGFLDFSNWMADNCPDIIALAKNWEQTVLFDIENSTYNMWWIISKDTAVVEVGPTPPLNYGLVIRLNFKTFKDILKQIETPLSAFLKGDLTYEGPFNDALKVSQITLVVSATVMDTYTPALFGGPTFQITSDNRDLYIDKGLTLFPCINVTINPDHIGEQHKSLIGSGTVFIVNHAGKIIAKLGNSGHSVHKFMNSTTIMMGGQDPGFMELWNYKTGKVETLDVPCGHHDLDYNPSSETFMVLEYIFSDEIWDGKRVIYDLLTEYTREGEEVWQWDPRIHFPFNATRHNSLGINETFRGGADWMHSNSFVWDKTQDVIYLNVRNLDTILKINYTTGEVIWDAGRGGEFLLLDESGAEVDTLFWHPHGLERLDSNSFIIYDNDLFNRSNPSTMTIENSSGYSRLLEFEIDEENQIMKETWSWVPQNESYYFPESGGDADRLPNGNTLGTFGDKGLVLNLRDPVIITEVTKNGTIAWEFQIPGKNNSYYWVQRVERFYEEPLITIHDKLLNLAEGTLWINLSTWNTFKQEFTSLGTIKIILDSEEFYQKSFEFLPQWQSKVIEISLNNLPSSLTTIELVIENEDGIKSSLIIYNRMTGHFFPYGPIVLILGSILIAIPSIVVFKEFRKTQKDF
ncbi:MAG: aryl-sulfate sulfotransferase [Promethearchaeota archaeon]